MDITRLAVVCLAVAFLGAAVPGMAGNATELKLDSSLTAALAEDDGPVRVVVTTHGAPHAAARAAAEHGGTITWTYSIIDGFAATLAPTAVERLAARPDVARVWLDRPVTTLMDVSHQAIGADKVWATGNRGAGVTVAVLDTGIDPVHPFFTGAVVACVSTIGGLVSPECTDTDGHGTHVAGTVASRDSRWPGVAPEASLAIVRVLHVAGAGFNSDIIAGMEWIVANKDRTNPPIRVVTMSIGYLSPGCGDDSNPDAQAANKVVEAGLFFSVAAGNSGHSKCTIDGSSAASKVTTIAAVDDRGTVTQDDDKIASFSSGGSSKNNKPDVSFPGVDITSAFIGAGTLVATLDGTSMATPHAAGTAALLVAAEPGLTATQVKDRVTGTAIKTSNTGSTFNFVYGHGLGNACKALKIADCGSTTPPPDPTVVRVASVEGSSTHGGGKNPPHDVTARARVTTTGGAAVEGASVAFEITSPEGNVHTASGTTGSDGWASATIRQRGGGHGTWSLCVTEVTGTNLLYDASKNGETCDTVVVPTH